ncbi:hypothetical protein F183_A26460 [Bryobacterales bacterium F-183]|nr:hypothetical protein F183_A26460 [Bryobacterales bacterium F-183]
MILQDVVSLAEFQPEKMGKVSLVGGQYLFAGLNCFEPGQEHAAHVHDGQDKLYTVLQGQGEARVGELVRSVKPGDIVFAPSGVVHSMKNASASERLVVMTVFGPPPHKK